MSIWWNPIEEQKCPILHSSRISTDKIHEVPAYEWCCCRCLHMNFRYWWVFFPLGLSLSHTYTLHNTHTDFAQICMSCTDSASLFKRTFGSSPHQPSSNGQSNGTLVQIKKWANMYKSTSTNAILEYVGKCIEISSDRRTRTFFTSNGALMMHRQRRESHAVSMSTRSIVGVCARFRRISVR